MTLLADSITHLSEELSCAGDDVLTADPSVMRQIPAVLEDTNARIAHSSSKPILLQARALVAELYSLARVYGTCEQRNALARKIQELDASIQACTFH
jgi:hypothetical protein